MAFAPLVPAHARAPVLPATAAKPADLDRAFTHHRPIVGDLRLHYVRGGKGPILILIHGWPVTWWEWHAIMPQLAEKFDVIAVDTRGLGDSTRPQAGYDKDTLGEDVIALARQLGIRRFSVAGHDLGGQIAFAMARNHPDMIERLAILDVPLMGLPGVESFKPWHFTFNTVPDVPEALTQGRERVYLDQFWSGLTNDPRRFTEEDIQEFLRTYTAAGAMRAGFSYYRAFEQDGEANRKWFMAGNRLRMPVLWLGSETVARPGGGGELGIGTGDLLGRQLAPVAPDLRGRSLPGCGHWLASDCAGQTGAILSDFFSGRSAD